MGSRLWTCWIVEVRARARECKMWLGVCGVCGRGGGRGEERGGAERCRVEGSLGGFVLRRATARHA